MEIHAGLLGRHPEVIYPHPMIFRFDPFELDLARAELRAGGETCPVEPQVFALIALLVENRERLVSSPFPTAELPRERPHRTQH